MPVAVSHAAPLVLYQSLPQKRRNRVDELPYEITTIAFKLEICKNAKRQFKAETENRITGEGSWE